MWLACGWLAARAAPAPARALPLRPLYSFDQFGASEDSPVRISELRILCDLSVCRTVPAVWGADHPRRSPRRGRPALLPLPNPGCDLSVCPPYGYGGPTISTWTRRSSPSLGHAPSFRPTHRQGWPRRRREPTMNGTMIGSRQRTRRSSPPLLGMLPASVRVTARVGRGAAVSGADYERGEATPLLGMLPASVRVTASLWASAVRAGLAEPPESRSRDSRLGARSRGDSTVCPPCGEAAYGQ